MANDIAVVIEHLEGKVADISFEMLGKGRELAKASGGQLLALLLGHGVKGLAAELGCADGVIVSEHETLRHYTPEAPKQALAAIRQARAPPAGRPGQRRSGDPVQGQHPRGRGAGPGAGRGAVRLKADRGSGMAPEDAAGGPGGGGGQARRLMWLRG